MRKIAVLVLLLAAAAFAFASSQSETSRAMPTSGKIVWTVWDDPATQGHQKIADEFAKDNPGSSVEFQVVPYANYEDKVRTMLAAGDAPDVVQVNDDFVVTYTKRNLIQPLDAWLSKSSLKRDDMYKSIWDFNIYQGKMMALSPVNKVRVFIYNKDLFQKAGLPMLPAKPETPTWNWDAMLEYAKKLTVKTGDQTTQWGAALLQDGGTEQIWTMNNQGEGLFSKDGKQLAAAWPEGIEAIQWLADLTHVAKVQPPWGTMQANNGANVNNMFVSGQLAMQAGGSFSISFAEKSKFAWDFAPEPMKKYGRNEGSLVCYAIPKNAKNPPLSWKLMEYMYKEKVQQIWAGTGFGIPAVQTYANKYYVDKSKPYNLQVVADSMAYCQSVNFTENTDEGKRLLRTWLFKAWAGEMSAKDAMNGAKKEVEPILAR
jgi:multiple sugar transport system substrate-binding protein